MSALAQVRSTITAASDPLPAYGTTEERWDALVALFTAGLDLTDATTDFPSTRHLSAKYRSRLNAFKARIRATGRDSVFREAAVENALAVLGPNGLWPAVNDLIRTAQIHGFNWRERSHDVGVRHG